MNYEKYSRRQLFLLALAINLAGWVLIICGVIGLYYLIVGA